MRSKKLTVTLCSKGKLSVGCPEVEIDYNNMRISIVDNVQRTIKISSVCEMQVEALWQTFWQVHTLCMLGEGYLYDIQSLVIEESSSGTRENMDKYADEFLENKIPHCHMMNTDFYGCDLFLLPCRKYVNSKSLEGWIILYDELVFPHNAFLYMTHINGLPLDMRTAYITECFEPLASYAANVNRESIPKLSTKNKNITLFDYLRYVVCKYGVDCFSREFESNMLDCSLRQLVNNRVRLLHLKKDMGTKVVPSATDNIAYSRKLHLLYRHTLLQLLGIRTELYQIKLMQDVAHWDKFFNYAKENKEDSPNE